jgi:predicted ribosome quality control (RQC) complex YloA/Tae2 family protein
MHFDAMTLACVTDELARTVAGGRIQQVLAPDERSIGLEIYAGRQRHYLLIVGGGRAARIQLVGRKLRRGVEQPSPLMLLLRKYVRDSTLVEVAQPDPAERVLHLRCQHAEHGATTLILELLGTHSNLVLVNPQRRILDCLHRIWPGEETTRPQAPGQPYHPPLPQDKLPPLDDGSADYYSRLGSILAAQEKLWRALVANVAGISPTLARELAWRASGDLETPAQEAALMAVIQALQELWRPVETGAWTPGIWRVAGQVAGFSAYIAHGRGDFIPTGSMSEALSLYYQQESGAQRADAYAGQRASVAALLRRAEARIERQLSALAGDEPAPGAADHLRTQAEWLLALHTEVAPGQTALTVDLGEEQLAIPLDPAHSPIEQAERWFKRAGRMERAARIIPERRAKLQADLEFVAQLKADLALAENQPEIASVRQELEKSRLLPPSQKKSQPVRRNEIPGRPRTLLSPQGFQILVGRNAGQNEHVTFVLAHANDLWLHVRGAPGSHVVVRSGGQPVSDETLEMAARLAAYYSSSRGERAATVVFTQRRHVSRAPGGRPGQVIVRQEQTITVHAELSEEERG